MTSLTVRGGANVEHASDLNRPEQASTAPNCTAATCAKSVFQVSALAGPDWQSKGQGFESPQLHCRSDASAQGISAGQSRCRPTVGDLLKINYSRGVHPIWSKSGARRPEGSKCCQRLLQTSAPFGSRPAWLNANWRSRRQVASATFADDRRGAAAIPSPCWRLRTRERLVGVQGRERVRP